jgi:hypothetical protein
MPKINLRYVSKWGLLGPNSEFLQDRFINRVEPYTIGKGLKRSARQSQKAI